MLASMLGGEIPRVGEKSFVSLPGISRGILVVGVPQSPLRTLVRVSGF
jgi:hypothetical protein